MGSSANLSPTFFRLVDSPPKKFIWIIIPLGMKSNMYECFGNPKKKKSHPMKHRFFGGIPIECHAQSSPIISLVQAPQQKAWNLHVQRQGIQPLRIGPRRRRRHHHALDANAPRAARRQRIVPGQEGHGAAGGVVAWWGNPWQMEMPKKNHGICCSFFLDG